MVKLAYILWKHCIGKACFSSAQNCKTDTSPAFLYVDSFLQRRQLEDQVNMCL